MIVTALMGKKKENSARLDATKGSTVHFSGYGTVPEVEFTNLFWMKNSR
jgi:hypothetical protein